MWIISYLSFSSSYLKYAIPSLPRYLCSFIYCSYSIRVYIIIQLLFYILLYPRRYHGFIHQNSTSFNYTIFAYFLLLACSFRTFLSFLEYFYYYQTILDSSASLHLSLSISSENLKYVFLFKPKLTFISTIVILYSNTI